MVNDKRNEIYDFLYSMFYGIVSNNVYRMGRPQELTQSDLNDGFIVLRCGQVNDESEFYRNVYNWCRVYVELYIPPKSRGRLNNNKFQEFESAISRELNRWENGKVSEDGFSIDIDSLISSDEFLTATNKDNPFHVVYHSFIVYNVNEDDAEYRGDVYIGLGGETLTNKSDVENLVNLKHYNKAEPNGDYVITFPGTMYLWFCTTSEITNVTSNGIDVPYEEPIGIDNLYCYRSSNAIIEGTMIFDVI